MNFNPEKQWLKPHFPINSVRKKRLDLLRSKSSSASCSPSPPPTLIGFKRRRLEDLLEEEDREIRVLVTRERRLVKKLGDVVQKIVEEGDKLKKIVEE